MADNTSIEWTDATWNPVTGCSVVSPGCTNCYAMKLAGTRLKHHPSRAGLTEESKAGPVWNGQVRLNEAEILRPLSWRRPRRIFVCAHGDLFHEAVPDEWIDRVFAAMALSPQHSFQVLTKRSARMRAYMDGSCGRIADTIVKARKSRGDKDMVLIPLPHIRPGRAWWPLPNVWLGVSAEDQRRADERIPDLLATLAAIRFASAEPLLGPIDWTVMGKTGGERWIDALTGAYSWRNGEFWEHGGVGPKLDWIIVGGESGRDARPMHPSWARQIRDDCAATGTAFFFKQWGEWMCSEIAADGTLDPALPLGQADRWRRWDGASFREAGKGESAKAFLAPGVVAASVGKRGAGRLLDGVEHNGFSVLGQAP